MQFLYLYKEASFLSSVTLLVALHECEQKSHRNATLRVNLLHLLKMINTSFSFWKEEEALLQKLSPGIQVHKYKNYLSLLSSYFVENLNDNHRCTPIEDTMGFILITKFGNMQLNDERYNTDKNMGSVIHRLVIGALSVHRW